jgi:outer membrane lipoprotein-sorting protein
MRKWIITMVVLFWMQGALAEGLTAVDIIRKAMDHYRGQTSYSQMSMIIHRSDWQREMSMRIWTRGDKHTLVRIIEPPRDAGNDTLSVDGNMWTYTPKTNRVIEVKPPMMSENWMGSDFSNLDVSRGTTITGQYDHTLLELRERDGHQIYVIQSIPQKGAAVQWGSEVLHIRDDWIVLEQQFRDKDDVLVKTLQALEIGTMSGRSVATVIRMGMEAAPDEWTELRTNLVEFDVELPPNLFTLSNLRNAGE